jgi:RNA-directed DNA polymerase
MLEREKAASQKIDGYQHLEYARWADDVVILVDGHKKWKGLEQTIHLRLREELTKIKVELNEEKTKIMDLAKGETFSFLGFDFRREKTRQGKIGITKTPKMKARTNLLGKLKEIFHNHRSQLVSRVIDLINPVMRGWVNYFRIGNSNKCFRYVKSWVEKKIRRHLMKTRKRKGFGWDKWSRGKLYEMGLYNDYQIRYYSPLKASPVR